MNAVVLLSLCLGVPVWSFTFDSIKATIDLKDQLMTESETQGNMKSKLDEVVQMVEVLQNRSCLQAEAGVEKEKDQQTTKTALRNLLTKYNTIQTEHGNMKSKLDEVVQMVEVLQNRASLQTAAGVEKAVSGRSVYNIAFTAAIEADIKLSNAQVVRYQLVLFDQGKGYDSRTGIFTCPQSGIYQFNFHALTSNPGKSMRLQLIHNNKFVVSLFAQSLLSSGGNTANIHLTRGDRVWVSSNGESNLRGNRDALYTTFSGFLMAPSYEEGV